MSREAVRASSSESKAARRIAEARWPDGVQCLFCDSRAVSERKRPERRWPQWRCRDCRKEFTAVTGTELHGTRRAPSELTDFAVLWEQHPSDATTGADARFSRTEKASRQRCTSSLSRGGLALMDALRRRPSGATLSKIAELAGMSERHSRRCLQELAERGFCEQAEEAVADGYMTIKVPLWRLTFSPVCLKALGELPPLPPLRSDHVRPNEVPHRYWGMFWSGATGQELRMDKDGLLVAGALIGSANLGAECWALRHTATEDLRHLRQMRGYDSGDVAAAVDAELRRRADAAIG